MQDILNSIDSEYLIYEPQIKSRQLVFYLTNNVFFQGLSTHTDDNIPITDGLTITRTDPNNLDATPTDQPIPWDSESFPPTLPCSMTMNVFNGLSDGFGVVLRINYQSGYYTKSIKYTINDNEISDGVSEGWVYYDTV